MLAAAGESLRASTQHSTPTHTHSRCQFIYLSIGHSNEGRAVEVRYRVALRNSGRVRQFATTICLREMLSSSAVLLARVHRAAGCCCRWRARARARRAFAASATARGPITAVRPVPLKLIAVSKGNVPAFDAAAAEYTDRLRRYTQWEEIVVKPNPKGVADADTQMATEAERVIKHVGPRDRVVLLDERGKDYTSKQLAQLLAEAGEDNVPALVFAIGGPYGHGPAMRQRADVVMRLSAMVMNHQVARVVLCEQLYRAWTILKGEPYHHG